MAETLKSNGWIPNGGCSRCGIQNWVNGSHPNYVVKTKQTSNLFKLVRDGIDVFPYTNGTFLESKLNELNMQQA